MTKILALALGMGALATGAFAAGDIADLDTNSDGLLTIEEVQAVYPDVTADQFSQIDTNSDGGVDADEFSAAQEAGLLPAAPAEEG